MKLLFPAIAALPLLFPLGGTVIELPVDGRADPAKLEAATGKLELETWDCPRHPHEDPGHVQLLECASCQQPMTRTEVDAKVDRYLRLDVEGQRLRVVSGPWPGIALLRQSAIEKALQGTGLTLRATGWRLRKHVVLEVEAAKGKREALEKALAAFGQVAFDRKGALVLVRLSDQKGGHDHAAMVAAVERAGCAVKDTLWIMNQCSGELVTAS